MRTKFYAIASTAVVYCMTLVAFHGTPSVTANAAESNVAAAWNLTAYSDDLAALFVAPKMEEPATPAADPVITGTIHEFNEDISSAGAKKLSLMIEKTAEKHGVDPYLVTALVSQESRFNQSAVSYVGARGLGQLMPETAAELGVDINSAQSNLDGAVRYLAQNLDTWSDKRDPIAFALASYNAGPGNVARYNGVPPFEETQHYVVTIKARYSQLRSGKVVNA